jgi:3-mercaptopropionate dioxygenase
MSNSASYKLPSRLQTFVTAFDSLLNSPNCSEPRVLSEGGALLKSLIIVDDWLPENYSKPRSDRYAQYLLYCDPAERFSVLSFVWTRHQSTPVHNHTVWGMVGVMRGAEKCEEYNLIDGLPVAAGHSHDMFVGDVDAVSPTVGDWHKVSYCDKSEAPVTVSIHVYGGNIGKLKRSKASVSTESNNTLHSPIEMFVSGYDNVNE